MYNMYIGTDCKVTKWADKKAKCATGLNPYVLYENRKHGLVVPPKMHTNPPIPIIKPPTGRRTDWETEAKRRHTKTAPMITTIIYICKGAPTRDALEILEGLQKRPS